MIIWTRWGILAFLFVGLGVALGFILYELFGPTDVRNSSLTGVFVGLGLILGGVGFYFFERFVMRVHLDKPRPVMLTQQAVQLPDGSVQPARQVPAINPETGQPVWVQPSSSLFFIHVRFWPYIIAAIGLVAFVVNLAGLASR